MNKTFRVILMSLLIWVFFSANAVNAQIINEDHFAYLIISNDFCIIIRSPSQQFTSEVGHSNLGIILKDKITRIVIQGDYLAIAVPPKLINATIKKYGLQKKTLIE